MTRGGVAGARQLGRCAASQHNGRTAWLAFHCETHVFPVRSAPMHMESRLVVDEKALAWT